MHRTIAAALVVLCNYLAVAAAPPPTPAEAATAAYFASIRSNPSLLLAFLAQMPKGGDLHNHLSGAIYAERVFSNSDPLVLGNKKNISLQLIRSHSERWRLPPSRRAVLQAFIYRFRKMEDTK